MTTLLSPTSAVILTYCFCFQPFLLESFKYQHMATIGKKELQDACSRAGFPDQMLEYGNLLTRTIKRLFSKREHTVELRGQL